MLHHARTHTRTYTHQRARIHRVELDYLRRMRDRNKVNAARTILTKWSKFLLMRPFTKWRENAVEFAEWRVKGRKAMMRMVHIYAHTTIHKARARICLCTRANYDSIGRHACSTTCKFFHVGAEAVVSLSLLSSRLRARSLFPNLYCTFIRSCRLWGVQCKSGLRSTCRPNVQREC